MPFPHVTHHPALPLDFYEELQATFPTADEWGLTPEVDFRLHAAQFLPSRQRLSSAWQAFWHYHLSREFLADLLLFWGDSVTLPLVPSLDECTLGIRNLYNGTIHFEGQYVAFTGAPPVVTEPHIAHWGSLLVILLYFPTLDNSETDGGDLQLFRFDKSPKVNRARQPVGEVTIDTVIPYRANQLVMFPNLSHSLHGVTRRNIDASPRRNIFISLEVPRR